MQGECFENRRKDVFIFFLKRNPQREKYYNQYRQEGFFTAGSYTGSFGERLDRQVKMTVVFRRMRNISVVKKGKSEVSFHKKQSSFCEKIICEDIFTVFFHFPLSFFVILV